MEYKICCISDLHGNLPEIPECDLLLIAGDICPVYDHSKDRQQIWLKTTFTQWANKQPAGKIIGTFGNHDFIAEHDPNIALSLPGTWLIDEWTEFKGLKIWASPYTPTFYNWAFMEGDDKLAERWAKIPDDVDILMTHGPPLGVGDLTADGDRAGSGTLWERVDELAALKFHIFGHIHEAYGQYGYRSLNVSHVNLLYQPVNTPVMKVINV